MKVAFLGTGLMGGLMAQRLIYKGFELRVWNRTVSKTKFSLRNLLKDASLALHAFSESGVNTIALEAVQKLLTQSVKSNLGDLDYAALYNVVFPER